MATARLAHAHHHATLAVAVAEVLVNVIILSSVLSDWTSNDELIAAAAVRKMATSLRKAEPAWAVTTLSVKDHTPAQLLAPSDPGSTVVLNWCEGLYTDERDFWSVPAELDRLGYVYTGSGPVALKVTQNKSKVKAILREAGVPVPEGFSCSRVEQARKWDTFPAIVKPAKEHGSFGITKDSVVDNRQQLLDRVEWVLQQFGPPAVVEEFIEGAEYNVAFTASGDGDLTWLPLAMIDFGDEQDTKARLVTYNSKWKSDTAVYGDQKAVCPARVSSELEQALHEAAAGAFCALALRDYGRVDVRVRDGLPYVVDVNANPDITSGAGFARAARLAGYSYGEMLAWLVEIAAERGGVR